MYLVIVGSFLTMSSFSSEDVTLEKDSTIKHRVSFNSNSSLPATCDNYTLTRTRNAFVSFLVSVQQSDHISYWYKIYYYNAGSLCELLRVGECIFSSILKICGLTRYQLFRGNMTIHILKTN